MAPSFGWTTGGTVVTLNGSGFTGATKVVFSTTAMSDVVVVSYLELRVTSPARSSTGAVDVRVTTPSGMSPTSSSAKFTFAS